MKKKDVVFTENFSDKKTLKYDFQTWKENLKIKFIKII